MSHITYFEITSEARKTMIVNSQAKYPRESGGILLGQCSRDHISILIASGPGPNAVHSNVSFKRDGKFTQEFLNEHLERFQENIDYIGEWHSHPMNQGPSSKDLKAMKWVAQNQNYKTTSPLMGLCRYQDREWIISFHLFDKGRLRALHEK